MRKLTTTEVLDDEFEYKLQCDVQEEWDNDDYVDYLMGPFNEEFFNGLEDWNKVQPQPYATVSPSLDLNLAIFEQQYKKTQAEADTLNDRFTALHVENVKLYSPNIKPPN